jgi:prepilin peptidase CpaA
LDAFFVESGGVSKINLTISDFPFLEIKLVGDMQNTLPMLLLVSIAAICDVRTGKIPNLLILSSVILGLCFTFLNGGIDGLLIGIAGFGVGFLLVMPGYLLRFTGAGDLKLLASLGILSGPGAILAIFALSVFAGALFILSKLLGRFLYKQGIFFWRSLSIRSSLPNTAGLFNERLSTRGSILKQRLPMAPFYALGCALFILLQLM